MSNNSLFKNIILIVYVSGIIVILFNNYFIYINNKSSKKICLITFIFSSLILCLNCYFSIRDKLHSHEKELELYSYVEKNGRVFLTASLVIIFFIQLAFTTLKGGAIHTKKLEYTILIPVILAFLFSVFILVIIWMPKTDGIYIRVLRDIKTVFLTNSINNVIVTFLLLLKAISHY